MKQETEQIKQVTEKDNLFQVFSEEKSFFSKTVFVILFLAIIAGTVLGSFFAVFSDVFSEGTYVPLLFSGIPNPELGMVSCFSSLLFNSLICLIIVFLLGLTAFGMAAIPVFILLKGMTIGIGVISFLFADGYQGWANCALIYTPVSAIASFFILLFAARAMLLSDQLVKIGFKSDKVTQIDFYAYLKDFMLYLFFAVLSSFAGTIFSFLYSAFFL